MPLSDAHKMAQKELNLRYSKALFLMAMSPPFQSNMRKFTKRDIVKYRISIFFERCRDAWLVLKGDAYISEDR